MTKNRCLNYGAIGVIGGISLFLILKIAEIKFNLVIGNLWYLFAQLGCILGISIGLIGGAIESIFKLKEKKE